MTRALPLLPLALLAACSWPFGSDAPPEVEAPPQDFASVKPGINEQFRGEIDVAAWVDRFEDEEREVFAWRYQIIEAVDVREGMGVADIGAGTGPFLAGFSRAAGPDGTVYAVEISEGFVRHLEQRARDEGLTNVEVVLCDDRSTNLPPGSIDRAFLCDTYHHLEYPRSTLASIRDALRPGGMLVVVDFERDPDESDEWVLHHVRAGRETVIRELEASGFVYQDAPDFLDENYVLRFRRP